MTLPWKKGPPPEGEAGVWLVWSEMGGQRIAFRIRPGALLRILDPGISEPASGWEASITHHLPEKITPPGEGEAPAPPSPREGGEGGELEGGGRDALVDDLCGVLEKLLTGRLTPSTYDDTVQEALDLVARARGEGA